MIEIAVRGVPVAKGRPRFSRATGHAYTPEKTRTFEGSLKTAAYEVMGHRPPLEGPVRIEVLTVVPIPRSWSKAKKAAALAGRTLPTGKPDWDNYGKTVDALNEVVWIDDGQIVDGRVRKLYGEAPGMWIRVWPFTPEEGWIFS